MPRLSAHEQNRKVRTSGAVCSESCTHGSNREGRGIISPLDSTNRHNGSLWYTLNNSEASAITQTALTGYLKELKFEKCERRGKEVYKLLITIHADRLYILESGHDTHFAKSVLAAIATLTPQQLYSPMTIQPQAGTDENVLFCRVWVGSELVMASYNEQSDWREISKQAIEVTKAANEMVF
jgi:hypothetical protein